MYLTIDNLEPFPRVARFTGQCRYWLVDDLTDNRLFLPAVFHWELAISLYHPSEIVFSRLISDIKEDGKMPKKPDNQTEKSNDSFKGFINIDLSEEDKAAITMNWKAAHAGKTIQELVDVGKVSLSYNEKTASYNCAIMFYAPDLKGWCLSSFAKNPIMAAYITWYKLDRYPDAAVPGGELSNKPDFG